jgi:hypothetical protein
MLVWLRPFLYLVGILYFLHIKVKVRRLTGT